MGWLSRLPVLVALVAMLGAAMLLPAIHAAATDDEQVARAFFYSAIVTVLAAFLVGIVTANRPATVSQHGQLLVLCGAYLVLPPVMALPVLQVLPGLPAGGVWFDMVSAFTTTGASVFDETGAVLPPTIHLWRAMAGWMGGAFVLVAALAILAPMNLGGAEVLTGRAPGQTGAGQMSVRLRRQAGLVLPAYAGLTGLLWIILMVAGDAPLAAAILALSTLSTSGILPPGGAFAPSGGIAAEIAVAAFLCLALSRRFLPGLPPSDRQRPVWRDSEVKLGAVLTLGVALVLASDHLLTALAGARPDADAALLPAVWAMVFGSLSFLTTTGFVPTGWITAHAWAGLPGEGLFLVGLAMIGGGVATTAGGVKLLRLYALFRHGERELERTIHPNSIGGRGEGARRLRSEGARIAWMYFLIFALTLGALMLVLTLTGLSFEAAMLVAVASLSSTGTLPAVAGTDVVAWAGLDGVQLTVGAVAMVLGRLEILAFLALTAPDAWRR